VKRVGLFGVLLCAWLSASSDGAQDAGNPAPFVPRLEVDADPECPSWLEAARKAYGVPAELKSESQSIKDRWSRLDRNAPNPVPRSLGWASITTLESAANAPVVLYTVVNRGCGGACESEQIIALESAIDGRLEDDVVESLRVDGKLSKAGFWTLARSTSGTGKFTSVP